MIILKKHGCKSWLPWKRQGWRTRHDDFIMFPDKFWETVLKFFYFWERDCLKSSPVWIWLISFYCLFIYLLFWFRLTHKILFRLSKTSRCDGGFFNAIDCICVRCDSASFLIEILISFSFTNANESLWVEKKKREIKIIFKSGINMQRYVLIISRTKLLNL